MTPFRALSVAEQVAGHLREQVRSGIYRGAMPGVFRLESELGVSRDTVEAALHLLEKDGLLEAQGPGRRRRILPPRNRAARQALRVAILPYDSPDRTEGYIHELSHHLVEAGHAAFFADRCLTQLDMKLDRVRALVTETAADAWVVCSASRPVLEWFAAQSAPAFAMYGNWLDLPIAGVKPERRMAVIHMVKALGQLGHRRIVMLGGHSRLHPEPRETQLAFLQAMAELGIPTGPYNLPDTGVTVEDYQAKLQSLFRVSPPTALLVDEVPYFVATLNFCAHRGIRVPEDVSLVCTDWNPAFACCRPTVAHMRWDPARVVRRILRWAGNVALGRNDRQQSYIPARYVSGHTVGPAGREVRK